MGDSPGLLSRSISFGQEGFRFSPTFPFPTFSRMARPSSACGTSRRSDVSASKLFLPYSAFDPQVLRPWKAARRSPACLYPNDVAANFCQACGSRTCLKKVVVPTKTVDQAEIAKRF